MFLVHSTCLFRNRSHAILTLPLRITTPAFVFHTSQRIYSRSPPSHKIIAIDGFVNKLTTTLSPRSRERESEKNTRVIRGHPRVMLMSQITSPSSRLKPRGSLSVRGQGRSLSSKVQVIKSVIITTILEVTSQISWSSRSEIVRFQMS